MRKTLTPFWARASLAAPIGFWNSIGRSGGMFWSLYPEDVDTSSCLSKAARRYRKKRNGMARDSRRKNR